MRGIVQMQKSSARIVGHQAIAGQAYRQRVKGILQPVVIHLPSFWPSSPVVERNLSRAARYIDSLPHPSCSTFCSLRTTPLM